MDARAHWEKVYAAKAPNEVSWHRPHLETSLRLIDRSAPNRTEAIIDIGGGESTLVDDLVAHGFHDITILEISQIATDVTKERLGRRADAIHWIVGDVTQVWRE